MGAFKSMRRFEGPLMSQYQKVKHLELVEVPQWKNHPPLMRGDFFRARLPSGSAVLFGSSPALPRLPELRFLSIPSFFKHSETGWRRWRLVSPPSFRIYRQQTGWACVWEWMCVEEWGGGGGTGGAVLFYWSGVSLVQTQISVLRFHHSLAVGV